MFLIAYKFSLPILSLPIQRSSRFSYQTSLRKTSWLLCFPNQNSPMYFSTTPTLPSRFLSHGLQDRPQADEHLRPLLSEDGACFVVLLGQLQVREAGPEVRQGVGCLRGHD